MNMKNLSNIFFILSFFLVSLASANSPPVNTTSLRVGVVDGYNPVSYFDAAGVPRGIAVELWEEIARNEHLSFNYVSLSPDMNKNWQALAQNKLDVLLGPVTVSTNVGEVSFSLPFFISPISAVVLKKSATFKDLLSGAIADYLNLIIVGYFVFFFIYMNLICFIERYFARYANGGFEGEVVPVKYWKAMWYIFYYHITFSDHFFDVKKTNLSRILYTLWIYATFAFLTILGATLTAILTTTSISNANTDSINQNTLLIKPFAYMQDRPFYKEFTENRHIAGVPANSMEQAVTMLRTHQVAGIINNQILLEEYLRLNHVTDIGISPYSLGYIFYYIGLPPHSPYERLININVVKLQRSDVQSAICRKYQISDPKYCSFY